MVRSGGRAQAMELCLEARLLAERLPASSSTDPNCSARSMSLVWSASQSLESRILSKERSMAKGGESENSRKVSRSWSRSNRLRWLWLGVLGFWEGQGRFAIDEGLCRMVSIAGGYQRECSLEVGIRNGRCGWHVYVVRGFRTPDGNLSVSQCNVKCHAASIFHYSASPNFFIFKRNC